MLEKLLMYLDLPKKRGEPHGALQITEILGKENPTWGQIMKDMPGGSSLNENHSVYCRIGDKKIDSKSFFLARTAA